MKIAFASLTAMLLAAACSAPETPGTRPPAIPPAIPSAATTRAPTGAPALIRPDTAAAYAFLRHNLRLSLADHSQVRGIDGAFFVRRPFALDSGVAAKLVLADTSKQAAIVAQAGGRPVRWLRLGLNRTPPAVLAEFIQQIQRLDTAFQRRFRWEPARLGSFVFVEGYDDHPRPAAAAAGATPAQRQDFAREIRAWNQGPRTERFVSYASLPLFSADGRHVLIVRGQSQPSIGWTSIFIYERTAQGWKILEGLPLSTI